MNLYYKNILHDFSIFIAIFTDRVSTGWQPDTSRISKNMFMMLLHLYRRN